MIRFLPLTLLLTACQPAIAQQQDGARMPQQLERADGNHDGAVSRQEFVSFREGQFPKLDRNGDGYVTESDIPALAKRRMPQGIDIGQMIRQFDQNGDKRLTRAEFVEGPTPVFTRVDADGDGVATLAERDAARAAFAALRQ